MDGRLEPMAEKSAPLIGKATMACSPERQHHPHRRKSNASRRAARDKNKCSKTTCKEFSVEKEGLAEKLNNTECFVEKPVSTIDSVEKPINAINVSEKPISSKTHLKPVNCNLDRFLDSTCPSVRAHHLPKSCQRENCRKRQQAGNVESLPYFILGDLWDCFDEWSAYGAGIPIILKGHGAVMQYYVPYLSALQIYTRSMKRQNIECSDVSSCTSDGDSIDMAVPDCAHCECGEHDHPGGGSIGACCGCYKFEKISELDFCRNSEEDEHSGGGGSRGSLENRDWHRHLRFEYFESSPPYSRVPISEKIAELAVGFPELKTLRSVDLLPASWMSIAWYPIYRIPTGPTLQDLEACFLTFHSLSTSLQDGGPSGIVKRSNRPIACAISASAEMQWEHPTIHLEAFGLAHYKLRGSIWTSVGNPERRHAASLYRCAESWLEQLRVGHPDFDFFKSHNPPSSAS